MEQFQGKSAFCGVRVMVACYGIPCEDQCKTSMHLKNVADGDDTAVSGMVKSFFSNNYDKGSQNIVWYLTHKRSHPNTVRHT